MRQTVSFYSFLLLLLILSACRKSDASDSLGEDKRIQDSLINAGLYFWSDQKKNVLKSDTNFLLVEFSASALEDKESIAAIEGISFLSADRALVNKSNLRAQGLLSVISTPHISQAIHAFTMGQSSIRPNGKIVFKLKESTEFVAAEKILSGRVNTVHEYHHNVFTAEVKRLDDLLDLANDFYESKLVEFSHPDFIADIRLTSLD